MSAKPQFYEFHGSVWVNAPKIAMSESGLKKGDDVEWTVIDLSKGENFNPEYLKINKAGTVPSLVVGGETYTDSTAVTSAVLKLAPHPPRTSAATSTSIIAEVHGDAHDPNATLIFARNDEDRAAKAAGFLAYFLKGRQEALDRYAPDAPAEFKHFLDAKQHGNRELLEFYTGNPTAEQREGHYKLANGLWDAAGVLIRGVITQAIQKTDGPFAGGEEPSEVDYHIITWLARTITNAGVAPGSPAAEAIPVLEKATGGHAFDPVIAKYWDTWIARDSFKDNNVH